MYLTDGQYYQQLEWHFCIHKENVKAGIETRWKIWSDHKARRLLKLRRYKNAFQPAPTNDL